MRIVMLGDIVGACGRQSVAQLVPQIHEQYKPDVVLANAETAWTERGRHASTSVPSVADFDGDGALDLALTKIGPTHRPEVRVITPSQENQEHWKTVFPATDRTGLPQPRMGERR